VPLQGEKGNFAAVRTVWGLHTTHLTLLVDQQEGMLSLLPFQKSWCEERLAQSKWSKHNCITCNSLFHECALCQFTFPGWCPWQSLRSVVINNKVSSKAYFVELFKMLQLTAIRQNVPEVAVQVNFILKFAFTLLQ